ncbi:helix-turn-helix domain-containing protein [Eisenbergiella porci]|uniref:helix-turn-helix domain-containing protein n=1 Tax=Eisenbergiella porci TaxID=2652274 RepID=UPI003FA47D38
MPYYAKNNTYSHLTLDERRIIFSSISNGSTKYAIAENIGKNKSTIGKELKLHRILTDKCPLKCSNYRKCVHGRGCTSYCPYFFKFICTPQGQVSRRLQRMPLTQILPP